MKKKIFWKKKKLKILCGNLLIYAEHARKPAHSLTRGSRDLKISLLAPSSISAQIRVSGVRISARKIPQNLSENTFMMH